MTYLSYIYFRFNTYPEECICVGLIMFDNIESKIKISDVKMKIARKILPNKNIFKMFNHSIKQLITNQQLTFNDVERLSIYQNGIIKIDKPSKITASIDTFDELFDKRLEANFK